MARVTVEDCVEKISNRFDLVLFAGQRSRQISAGDELAVDRDNDKNPVVALREIADTAVSTVDLREAVIRSMQRHVEQDEPEEDDMALLMAEQGWSSGSNKGTRDSGIASSEVGKPKSASESKDFDY